MTSTPQRAIQLRHRRASENCGLHVHVCAAAMDRGTDRFGRIGRQTFAQIDADAMREATCATSPRPKKVLVRPSSGRKTDRQRRVERFVLVFEAATALAEMRIFDSDTSSRRCSRGNSARTADMRWPTPCRGRRSDALARKVQRRTDRKALKVS